MFGKSALSNPKQFVGVSGDYRIYYQGEYRSEVSLWTWPLEVHGKFTVTCRGQKPRVFWANCHVQNFFNEMKGGN